MATLDPQIIEEGVTRLLEKVRETAPNTNIVTVDLQHLYRAWGLKNTARHRLPLLINDMLSGAGVVEKFGWWLIVEFEYRSHMLIRIPDGVNGDPVPMLESSVRRNGDIKLEPCSTAEYLREHLGEDNTED